MVCLLLVSCQKSVHVGSDRATAAHQDVELISNEADYLYVFDKVEAQISTAPNRIKDTRLTKYIETVLCQLSADYCQQVRIYVLESPEFNAHILPNGAFILLTGLLLRVDNESQLAYVLAHELGHYVSKHGIKKINFSKLKYANENLKPLDSSSGFASYLSLNSYTQQLEIDADNYAITLLNNHLYDLNQVTRLFMNLLMENKAAKKENIGGFNSSHPGTEQRISLIQKLAVNTISRHRVNEESWSKIKVLYIKTWLQKELQKREFESSLVLLERLKGNAAEPLYFDYYFGELYAKQLGRLNQLKAADYYLSHLQATTRIGDVYKNLADVYVQLNEHESAKTYYLKYLELVPSADDYNLIEQRLARLQ